MPWGCACSVFMRSHHSSAAPCRQLFLSQGNKNNCRMKKTIKKDQKMLYYVKCFVYETDFVRLMVGTCINNAWSAYVYLLSRQDSVAVFTFLKGTPNEMNKIPVAKPARYRRNQQFLLLNNPLPLKPLALP